MSLFGTDLPKEEVCIRMNMIVIKLNSQIYYYLVSR
jgi:hypothetical protein